MNLKRVVVAPDKFRGSISARDLALGIAGHLEQRGVRSSVFPQSDGGEGFLECFSGEEVLVGLDGPLGAPQGAKFLLAPSPTGVVGIVESAEAIGRHRMPHPTAEEAFLASSRPLGELLLACCEAGATELLVGLGGSATSDGGQGVFDVLTERGGISVPITVACDVDVGYLDALTFAHQKGIAPSDMRRVADRLQRTAARFAAHTGIDPTRLSGAGAAGGIGGALQCLGGRAVLGAQLVAHHSGLSDELESATLLITGEGSLDTTSLRGKVVGNLLRTAPEPVTVLIIAGTADTATVEEVERLRPGSHVLVLDRAVPTTIALREPLAVAIDLLDDLLGNRGPS